MGSALQRLEILLIGLVVLIAGAVAALLLVLRPLSQPAAQSSMPQPLVTRAPALPTSTPVLGSTNLLAQYPTLAPTITAPAAIHAPTTEIAHPSGTVAAPSGAPLHLTLPPILAASWSWFLVPLGLVGIALVLIRRRRRRMTYTNQTVGQLLAAADATTRTDNLKIMRGLAEQGLLTVELAAAAGINLSQSQQNPMPKLRRVRLVLLRIALPRLTRPALRLPAVRVPQLRLPRRATCLVTNLSQGSASVEVVPTDRLDDTMPALVTDPESDAASLSGEPAMHAVEPPETAPRDHALAANGAVPWTAEDRALAVAQAVAEIWAEHAASCETPIQSAIVALDTSSTPRHTGAVREPPVLVTIDGHPDEETLIRELPERIEALHPTWQASWQKDVLQVSIAVDEAQSPIGGPLIIPVLTHERGGTTIRFFPLASWRHLGFYGAGATGALHAALASLLFAQPPSDLALAILDKGEVAPLYRDAAHLVPLPGDAHETIELLAQALRHGAVSSVQGTLRTPRPLVLVVVEPDDALLTRLSGLVARLQARPTAPLHLMIVQERLSSAGRELYAILPALIVSGGQGSPALLPGQGAWPRRGQARLVGRGMRLEGRAIGLDEAAIAAHLAQVRGRPDALPPVLWDGTPISLSTPAPALISEALGSAVIVDGLNGGEEPHERVVVTSSPEAIEESESAVDDAAQRRRIASVMTARRQALMDADAAPTEPAALTASSGAQDAPEDTLTLVPDAAALANDAPAPAQTLLMTESIIEAAPDAPDGHDVPDTPAPSRRAALLLATLDAGAAADMPLSLVAPQQEPPAAAAPSQAASTTSPVPAPMVEPDNGWPIGPTPLGRIAMADLLARVVATPAIVAGQANELGVTKNRIVDLLKGAHKAQAKELAEILMVWFDLANLLVEPTKPGRLRHPRALVTTNLAEIAAQLNATACPDKGTVKRLWAESNEGNT